MTETGIALNELDNLIQLLEKRLPGNVEDPKNQRLTKSLERDMHEYFRQIEMALPTEQLEQLYYKAVGIAESPVKSLNEALIEIPEIITVQGEKGDKGEQGEKGDRGEDGKMGISGERGEQGLKGDKGDNGAQGIQGERGEIGIRGERGEQGMVGIQGEKGEKGDVGLTKPQQNDLKKIIKNFSDKKFIEDDDPRLTDKREPKPHKHSEIQPVIMSYPVMNVGGVSGGIQSEAPEGYLEVTNIYYDPETGKMVVVYKGE